MVQTCIYCRSTTGPFTGEHVLGRSLGGNLKIKDVCEICNNQRLSKIDQALAERSTISLSRLVRTPTTQPVRLGGAHFIEESGLDIEVRVGNELDARALPQIHAPLPFTPARTTLTTHCDSWPAFDAFVKLVELRIAEGDSSEDAHLREQHANTAIDQPGAASEQRVGYTRRDRGARPCIPRLAPEALASVHGAAITRTSDYAAARHDASYGSGT
jgi:hypothetical protein